MPIRDHLDRLYPAGGRAMVAYLGPATLTAILHVTYPDRYGVQNGTTEAGMRQLGIWPELAPTASTGER